MKNYLIFRRLLQISWYFENFPVSLTFYSLENKEFSFFKKEDSLIWPSENRRDGNPTQAYSKFFHFRIQPIQTWYQKPNIPILFFHYWDSFFKHLLCFQTNLYIFSFKKNQNELLNYTFSVDFRFSYKEKHPNLSIWELPILAIHCCLFK